MLQQSILFIAITATVACMAVTPSIAQTKIRHTIEAPKSTAEGFLRCDLGPKEEQIVALISGQKVYDSSIAESVVTDHLVSYDLKTGKEINRIPLGPFRAGRGDSIQCEFNARHSLVVLTSSSSGSVVVDISNERKLYASKSLIGQPIISANGELVVWTETSTDRKKRGKKTRMVIFRRDTRKLLRSNEHVDGEVRALEFSPDSALVAAYCEDGKARVWNTGTAKLEKEMTIPAPPLSEDNGFRVWLRFAPDSKSLCTATHPRQKSFLNFPVQCAVNLWDLKTGAERTLVKHSIREPYQRNQDNGIPFIRFSPDSKSVALVDDPLSDDIHLKILDIETSKVARKWQIFDANADGLNSGPSPELFISPDGETLVTVASAKGSTSWGASLLKLWEYDSGRQIAKLTEHDDGGVTQVIFSSDGKTMISMSYGAIRIWDLK